MDREGWSVLEHLWCITAAADHWIRETLSKGLSVNNRCEREMDREIKERLRERERENVGEERERER